jgi:uncharacterized protein (DUF305 family)
MKMLIVLAVILASMPAFAQMQHHDPASGMPAEATKTTDPGMMHAGAPAPAEDQSPSSLAFRDINMKMHEAMNITLSGNADVDFMHGMIPHHQGAIDMAKMVLAFGRDPEVRKLAEEIVKAQESEIAMMRAWLAKNAKNTK